MKLLRSKTTGSYRVRILTEHGQRVIDTGAKSRPEAIKIINAAHVPELERAARTVRLTNEVVNQIRFGRSVKASDAVMQFEEHLRLYARSQKTAVNKLLTVRAWLRDKNISGLPAHSVKPAHIDGWINDPKSLDKSGTRGFKLSCLRAFFSFCATQQFILTDPTLDLHVRMEFLRHQQKEPKRQRAFTTEEFTKLMAFYDARNWALAKERLDLMTREAEARANGEHPGAIVALVTVNLETIRRLQFWKTATLIGRHTGLRLGDVCRLESASFDAKAARLIVWTGKTGKRVDLPLPEPLLEALKNWGSSDPIFLFPTQAAAYGDVRRRSSLSQAFCRFCDSAGIPGHGFHDLRFAFSQECRAAGIPTPHIAERLGHGSTVTTEGYLE